MLKSAINVPEQQAVFRSPEVHIVLLPFYFFGGGSCWLSALACLPQLAWQLAQKGCVVVATAAVFSMFILKPSFLFLFVLVNSRASTTFLLLLAGKYLLTR
jgi:hypothetical protein